MACNTIEFHAISLNVMQYHRILCNTIEYDAIPFNSTQQHAIAHNNMQYSQVPQPTCYWKWVGSTIPLKQDNLTLQASRAFNMARTLEQVNLLEKSAYGEFSVARTFIHELVATLQLPDSPHTDSSKQFTC